MNLLLTQLSVIRIKVNKNLDKTVFGRTWRRRRGRWTPEITIRAPVTDAATATQRRAGGQRARGQDPGAGHQPLLAATHILSGLRRRGEVRLRFAL